MSPLPNTFGRRFWELAPVGTSLFLILFPLVGIFFFPVGVTLYVVLYLFLWFLFALEYMIFLLVAFFKTERARKVDWQEKLALLQEGKDLTEEETMRRERLREANDWIAPEEVLHLVIVATCGESINVLRETFASLIDSQYDKDRIFVCLATEERQKESCRAHAAVLQKEMKWVFGRFFWTEHPDGITGEVRGKGANITFAARTVSALLSSEGVPAQRVLVTTLDADNKVDPQYFSALTYHFCLAEKRQKRSYQPIPLFYNNIWDVPLLNRMLAISSGFWHMIESGRPDRLRNFASHAQPLQALQEMDFWSVHTIVEDGHQFWRSYLHFRGDYEVIPIFIPIYQDAVLNQNYYRSLVGQYKQMRRWAWGCSDIPFCAHHFWQRRKILPREKTLLHFFRLFQGHVMWATSALFIAVSTPFARFMNTYFQETTIASNATFLLKIFFQVALFGILISMAISLSTLPPAPTRWKRVSLIWQWLLLPVMTILMGSFPALEAQFRLAFQKPLEFNVTEKVRRSRPLKGAS